jgi:ABC-type sugar transport system ATPase subunit
MEVRVEGLTKKYGELYALKGVHMTAPSGKVTVVVGPSGSGKSTLLRLIAGLEEPLAGEVLFDGKLVLDPPERRGVGMVFQSLALFPHMSAFENIAFGLENKRLPKAAVTSRVQEVAKLVGIAERLEAKPDQLSGGQQQRLALARALAPNPNVLLLDEPFSNLDPRLREVMRWEVKRIQAETNNTVIHVTHDHLEALSLADHLVVLREGLVEQQGEAAEVFDKPKNSFVAWFLGYNVVELNGEKLCFKPNEAQLTAPCDGELVGEVKAVQNSLFGKKVRVENDGWSAELFSEENIGIRSRVGIRLQRRITLKE